MTKRIDNGAEDVMDAILSERPEFKAVICCGKRVAIVNSRPFTEAASQKLGEIEQRLAEQGITTDWPMHPDAKAILDNPANYETPTNGTPIMFTCPACDAGFTWIDGEPVKRGASS